MTDFRFSRRLPVDRGEVWVTQKLSEKGANVDFVRSRLRLQIEFQRGFRMAAGAGYKWEIFLRSAMERCISSRRVLSSGTRKIDDGCRIMSVSSAKSTLIGTLILPSVIRQGQHSISRHISLSAALQSILLARKVCTLGSAATNIRASVCSLAELLSRLSHVYFGRRSCSDA